MWAHFAQRIDESFRGFVDFGVCVVECVRLASRCFRPVILVRTEIDLFLFVFIHAQLIIFIPLLLLLLLLLVMIIVHLLITQLIIWINAMASIRIGDLLSIAVRDELVGLMVVSALLHLWRRLYRVLSVALASLLLLLRLDLESELPPVPEEASHVFHPMVGVEKSCHCI